MGCKGGVNGLWKQQVRYEECKRLLCGGGFKLCKTIIIFKVTDTNTKCFVCSASSENVGFNLTSHFSGCACVLTDMLSNPAVTSAVRYWCIA